MCEAYKNLKCHQQIAYKAIRFLTDAQFYEITVFT